MTLNSLSKSNDPCLENKAAKEWRKYIFAILFSNVACLFDFVIFIHFDKVLSATFFPPGSSPVVAQLQSLALFSIGFLSRPFGALLIGRYGDIHGRMPAFTISLLIFAITTLLMAGLPTYMQVGILAPILFITLRLVQGVAFGALIPIGWVFTAEHAPRDRFAIYSNFVTASFAFGNVLAFSMVALLSSLFALEALVSYGWRIPFIFGGILSLIALFLKRNINETPLFLQYRSKYKKPPKFSNIMPIFKRHQAIVLAALLSFTLVSMAMMVILTPKLIAIKFNLDSTFLSIAYLIIVTFAMIGLMFYGWLADKYPVGKVMVGGAIVLILHTLVFYIFLSSDSLFFILPMCALLGFFSGVRGLPAVIMVQLFPTNVRLTSVSVIYTTVSAIVGSILPIGLFYATNIISGAPGLFITFIGLVMILTGLLVQNSPGLNKFENLVDSNKDFAGI